MTPDAAHQGRRATAPRPASPLATVILVAAGCGLLGAGVVLSWRYGGVVSLGDSVLGVLAWCFQ